MFSEWNNFKAGEIIKVPRDVHYSFKFPQKDFYDKIIEHFGNENQCFVAIEELSELQKEICKHLRGLGNIHNIAEEIADVQIMLEQLQRIFKCRSEVMLLKEQKIQRTTERYLKE